MFLLKILNKSIVSFNHVIRYNLHYLFGKIKMLKFLKETNKLSFYLHLLFLFTLTRFDTIKLKTNYVTLCILTALFNKKNLINYIINITFSYTNTIVNINNINGNPKIFYSAGMFNLQKKQKTKQPKAVMTILKTLLNKSKFLKNNPAALHFNQMTLHYKSHIIKNLKRKTFITRILSHNCVSHNGCRLKKKKRYKMRTKTKN